MLRASGGLLALLLVACSSTDAGSPAGGPGALDGGSSDDGTVVGPGVDGGSDATNDGDASPPDAIAPLPDAGTTLPPINPSPCGGKVHCVKPGDDLQAVLAASASGDVVQVAEGTFKGNFVVSGKALLVAGGFDTTFAM